MQTIIDGTNHNSTLVGVDAHGTVVCQGDGLVGATFVARSPSATAAGKPIRTTFKFAEVRKTSDKQFEAYRILGETDDREQPMVNACDANKVNLIRSHMNLPPADSYTIPGVSSNDPDADVAIAVTGPVYDTTNQPIRNTDSMFNIACAQDALAKRTSFGLESCDEDKNTDALRMLTATYCKRPYTAHGAWVGWRRKDELPPETATAHEARWDGRKTTCFDTARVRYLKDAHQNDVPIAAYPPALLPKGCAAPNKCVTFDDYENAIRAECDEPKDRGVAGAPPSTLPKCDSVNDGLAADLESYVVTAPESLGASKGYVIAAAAISSACRKGSVLRSATVPPKNR